MRIAVDAHGAGRKNRAAKCYVTATAMFGRARRAAIMAAASRGRAAGRCDWRHRKGGAPPRDSLRLPPSVCRFEIGAGGRWMVVRHFVSESERVALFRKAAGHMQRRELHPNPAGPGRYFAKCDDDPTCYVDTLLHQLTRRCERCLRLQATPHDCVLGRTLSLILPGGFIHRHTDKYMEGMPGHRPGLEHLRCNILVRMADPSGRPVVEDTALPVEEGDLWVFFASKCQHETRPLKGSEPRIIYGFGWSVPPSHALEAPPADWDERTE